MVCNQYEKVKRNIQGMYEEADALLITEESPRGAHPVLFVIFNLNVTKLSGMNLFTFYKYMVFLHKILFIHFYGYVFIFTAKPNTINVLLRTTNICTRI